MKSAHRWIMCSTRMREESRANAIYEYSFGLTILPCFAWRPHHSIGVIAEPQIDDPRGSLRASPPLSYMYGTKLGGLCRNANIRGPVGLPQACATACKGGNHVLSFERVCKQRRPRYCVKAASLGSVPEGAKTIWWRVLDGIFVSQTLCHMAARHVPLPRSLDQMPRWDGSVPSACCCGSLERATRNFGNSSIFHLDERGAVVSGKGARGKDIGSKPLLSTGRRGNSSTGVLQVSTEYLLVSPYLSASWPWQEMFGPRSIDNTRFMAAGTRRSLTMNVHVV